MVTGALDFTRFFKSEESAAFVMLPPSFDKPKSFDPQMQDLRERMMNTKESNHF